MTDIHVGTVNVTAGEYDVVLRPRSTTPPPPPPPSGDMTVTLLSDTVRVTVGSSSHVQDWVGIAYAGSPPDQFIDWRFLSDSPVEPSAPVSPATVHLLRLDPGVYEVRLFRANGYEIAVSVPLTIPVVAGQRRLLGGYRLVCPWAYGSIALNGNKLFMAGHGNYRDILEFDLPPLVSSVNPAEFPALSPVAVHPAWSPAEQGETYGLAWFRGKLWISPRVGYDTTPPESLTLYARDGERITVPIPRQKFAGFVKRKNQEPLLGGGGYNSGQGISCGPTLARMDGTRLLEFGWPPNPGESLEHWNERCPREPNYYPINHNDAWYAWEPRFVNSVKEGRWASDRIGGGGLLLDDGLYYWVWKGCGDVDYVRQTETFGQYTECYEYKFDPVTYQLIGWKRTPFKHIAGQDVDSAGRMYLCEMNAWQSDNYRVDPILRVYGV